MNPRDIEERALEMADDLASSRGLVVVDVSYRQARGSWVLEICLHRPEGISTDDCADFSRALGDLLDVEGFMPSTYHLDVASPGLDRTLKSDREFTIFAGRKIEVRTYAPVKGRKEFLGILRGIEGSDLVLENEDSTMLRLPRDKVARARLHVEF